MLRPVYIWKSAIAGNKYERAGRLPAVIGSP